VHAVSEFLAEVSREAQGDEGGNRGTHIKNSVDVLSEARLVAGFVDQGLGCQHDDIGTSEGDAVDGALSCQGGQEERPRPRSVSGGEGALLTILVGEVTERSDRVLKVDVGDVAEEGKPPWLGDGFGAVGHFLHLGD